MSRERGLFVHFCIEQLFCYKTRFPNFRYISLKIKVQLLRILHLSGSFSRLNRWKIPKYFYKLNLRFTNSLPLPTPHPQLNHFILHVRILPAFFSAFPFYHFHPPETLTRKENPFLLPVKTFFNRTKMAPFANYEFKCSLYFS